MKNNGFFESIQECKKQTDRVYDPNRSNLVKKFYELTDSYKKQTGIDLMLGELSIYPKDDTRVISELVIIVSETDIEEMPFVLAAMGYHGNRSNLVFYALDNDANIFEVGKNSEVYNQAKRVYLDVHNAECVYFYDAVYDATGVNNQAFFDNLMEEVKRGHIRDVSEILAYKSISAEQFEILSETIKKVKDFGREFESIEHFKKQATPGQCLTLTFANTRDERGRLDFINGYLGPHTYIEFATEVDDELVVMFVYKDNDY